MSTTKDKSTAFQIFEASALKIIRAKMTRRFEEYSIFRNIISEGFCQALSNEQKVEPDSNRCISI